jgi:hypothetical protein
MYAVFVELKALWDSISPNVRATWISVVTSSIVYLMTHIKNHKPILVLVRRQSTIWHIKNIGNTPAFDVRLEAFNAKNGSRNFNIYPIGENDKVYLHNIRYGDKLVVHYRSWWKWRNYTTTCVKWTNQIVFHFRSQVKWKEGEYLDESRLSPGQQILNELSDKF